MNASGVVSLFQLMLGFGAGTFGAWWSLLSVLAVPAARGRASKPGLRFVAVVPAHNEEALIAATVDSVSSAPYHPRPEVLVVADNCTDATASVARSRGATVVARQDSAHLGKSFALDFAITQLRSREAAPPDVVVVVDADTTVGPSFFEALAAAMEESPIAQARYDAAPSSSELGRLRRLALALVHHARPLGAQRLGLPTTLKGNGMAFRWDVVREGIPGSGITEDAAATLDLAARGLCVRYVPDARIAGLMAEGYQQAMTQDSRWEGGRFALIPRALWVFCKGLARGQLRSAAAAAEVASPPLTLVGMGAATALLLGLAGFGSWRLGIASVLSVFSYVGMGLLAARADRSDLMALIGAPRFVGHKFVAFGGVIRSRPKEWERTERGGGVPE